VSDTNVVDVERLYTTTKADMWAAEFAKVCPEVDQGLMIGWFANAIETGRRASVDERIVALINEESLHQREFWPNNSPEYAQGRRDGLQRAVGIIREALASAFAERTVDG
jgi:hypothetical protein